MYQEIIPDLNIDDQEILSEINKDQKDILSSQISIGNQMCYTCKIELAMRFCIVCREGRCYKCFTEAKSKIGCSRCKEIYKQNMFKPRCDCRDLHTWGVITCYSLDVGWGLINTTGSGPKHWNICNEHYQKRDQSDHKTELLYVKKE